MEKVKSFQELVFEHDKYIRERECSGCFLNQSLAAFIYEYMNGKIIELSIRDTDESLKAIIETYEQDVRLRNFMIEEYRSKFERLSIELKAEREIVDYYANKENWDSNKSSDPSNASINESDIYRSGFEYDTGNSEWHGGARANCQKSLRQVIL